VASLVASATGITWTSSVPRLGGRDSTSGVRCSRRGDTTPSGSRSTVPPVGGAVRVTDDGLGQERTSDGARDCLERIVVRWRASWMLRERRSKWPKPGRVRRSAPRCAPVGACVVGDRSRRARPSETHRVGCPASWTAAALGPQRSVARACSRCRGRVPPRHASTKRAPGCASLPRGRSTDARSGLCAGWPRRSVSALATG